jgi:16S rRNA processing protein RimM
LGTICPEDLLLIGKVVRPHGLKGLLRIISYADSPDTFLKAGEVFLQGGSGKTVKHGIISITPSKKFFLLHLEGLDSLEEAEMRRDWNIYIEKSGLSKGGDYEYFWYEIIGLPVFLDTGKRIGTIMQIVPGAGHDIYVVQDGAKETLIPAVHEVIKEVDLENEKVVVTEVEGLLDLNEV